MSIVLSSEERSLLYTHLGFHGLRFTKLHFCHTPSCAAKCFNGSLIMADFFPTCGYEGEPVISIEPTLSYSYMLSCSMVENMANNKIVNFSDDLYHYDPYVITAKYFSNNNIHATFVSAVEKGLDENGAELSYLQ